jgi:hypothetical protein
LAGLHHEVFARPQVGHVAWRAVIVPSIAGKLNGALAGVGRSFSWRHALRSPPQASMAISLCDRLEARLVGAEALIRSWPTHRGTDKKGVRKDFASDNVRWKPSESP